jgi:SAM-dependent methyltransferase
MLAGCRKPRPDGPAIEPVRFGKIRRQSGQDSEHDMPKLDSPMHVDSLESARRDGQIERDGLYGLQWGDPQTMPALKRVRDCFILPYVHPDRTALEIGPGGGRWTRYLLGFDRLYVVDYHQALLDELARSFRTPYLKLIKNSGADLLGIADESVDFAFSFGVFVHLELAVIENYFQELRRVLKPDGCAVIQYSDKTKEAARQHGEWFTDTTPDIIIPLVQECGHRVIEEDRLSLIHSSVVRFGRR